MAKIFTIGHSTRSFSELVDLLKGNKVELLVDVRRFPGSKRHPQFNQGNLEESLPGLNINYRHKGRFGGRRGTPEEDSPNSGWESQGFQAYADHLLSGKGQAAFRELASLAKQRRTAIMCAEVVPWRCHRQVIADYLVAHGHQVIHILGPDQKDAHTLRGMARVREDNSVIYPAQGKQEDLFGNGNT